VSLGVSEETLPDEGFAEEKLNIFLIPAASRQSLQEHHDLLKVHLEQLIGPFDQESSADVEMEVGEPLVLSLSIVSLDTDPYWVHQHTKYVSHILMVFLTLISRMSKQFIHRKLN
jgi:cAMP phosphodiesterase